ncbi:Uma2 family endonuclease [Frankia sp. Cppng1_Ct_nod]|uniref:Uma2 family endonuclease n=1 Tax=Frankia sp. Cppng1_Ct_nod TaxID=2897162 RepID=UPI0013EF9895|nr:Uma2 family endonuclease [Frankia sp. Cppng1_Ct_nod]
MRTVVLGERPRVLEEFIARRQTLGQDTFDEVWNGEYHMAPGPSAEHGRVDYELSALLRPRARAAGLVGTGPFNLGRRDDYRVPDGGLHRGSPSGVFLPTAAVVIEIVSPDDETFAKIDFYAAHGVDELVVADPARRTVQIWQLVNGKYDETGRSDLLHVTAAELTRDIDWP